jgi:hypothetical protein
VTTLQAWVANLVTDRPPLQIVSYLEVLLCLRGGADLRPAVVKELAARAAASPATQELFARYAAVSDVAAAISRAGQGGNAGGVQATPASGSQAVATRRGSTAPRPGKQRTRRGQQPARGEPWRTASGKAD